MKVKVTRDLIECSDDELREALDDARERARGPYVFQRHLDEALLRFKTIAAEAKRRGIKMVKS